MDRRAVGIVWDVKNLSLAMFGFLLPFVLFGPSHSHAEDRHPTADEFLDLVVDIERDGSETVSKWSKPVVVTFLGMNELADSDEVSDGALRMLSDVTKLTGLDIRSYVAQEDEPLDAGTNFFVFLFKKEEIRYGLEALLKKGVLFDREPEIGFLEEYDRFFSDGQRYCQSFRSVSDADATILYNLLIVENDKEWVVPCVRLGIIRGFGAYNKIDTDQDTAFTGVVDTSEKPQKTGISAFDKCVLASLYRPEFKSGMSRRQVVEVMLETGIVDLDTGELKCLGS